MLSLRIALRYLLSRKSHGAVNIISAVSMAGVAVAAAAMIIVLSVFNGFSQLIEKKTANFNPPLLIKPIAGATIANADSMAFAIQQREDIAIASPMIDEQAFAVAVGGQMPLTLRAMTDEAISRAGLSKILVDGEIVKHPGVLANKWALISVGVAMKLNLRPNAAQRQQVDGPVTDILQIYEPRRVGRINPANPTTAFRGDSLIVDGVYQVEQEEQDRDMIIMSLSAARDLLDYTTEATGIALYPAASLIRTDSRQLESLKKDVIAQLPEGVRILTSMEQEAESHRMIAIEKWITFLMLLFILAVASFNIISTLSLMVVEKEKNMGVLAAMGAEKSLIRKIFANQGWLVTTIGGSIGMVIGSLLTLGQQHFGWIKLSSANPALMTIDHYPVCLHVSDLIIVFISILLTSLIIAYIGSRIAGKSVSMKS
jgi:ABC-type lipoprotein release transport system permease subunit